MTYLIGTVVALIGAYFLGHEVVLPLYQHVNAALGAL